MKSKHIVREEICHMSFPHKLKDLKLSIVTHTLKSLNFHFLYPADTKLKVQERHKCES